MRAERRSACRRHFIIIGAMKAGTTSLFRFLTAHPEISGPSAKELHYFSLDAARYGRVGYELKFLGLPGPLLGEASPSYAEYPRFGDTARRIRMLLPRVRLIYCVRDPVERMRSHFNHEILEGRQQPTADQMAWTTEYLGPSLYGLQLERYLRYFDPSVIAVVDASELRNRREHTMTRLYEFLGVDAEWPGASSLSDQNVSDERTRINPAVAPLKRWPATRRMARLFPSSVRRAVRSAASVRESRTDGPVPPVEIPPIPPDMRAHLRADRRLFDELAAECVAIGPGDPSTWWGPTVTDEVDVPAAATSRLPVGHPQRAG